MDVLHPDIYEAPKDWQGMQEVAADRRGDVFLLRSDTLEVYELPRPGKPKLALQLEETGPYSGQFRPLFAIMGEEAGDWLMIGDGIRWFQQGTQQAIEGPGLNEIGVVLPGGEPVVLLGLDGMPFYRLETDDGVGRPGAELPLLVHWSGDDWDTLVAESVEGLDSAGGMQRRFSILAADGPDLWIARSFAPWLQKLSLDGRLKQELLTDFAVDLELEDEAKAKLAETLGATEPPARAPAADKPATQGAKVVRTASRRTFHFGMTVADGVVYTVVGIPEDGGGRRLRRWDPVRQVLEEVALGIDFPGRCSLAMGRDGLHIAPYDSRQGRAFLPREMLEAAGWRPVEDVLLDGFPLPAAADPEADAKD